MPTDFAAERDRMIDEQLTPRGIRDLRVIEAMRAVPRELFVPDQYQAQAYADCALPIEAGQTISQPYVVALMAQALELDEDDRVLEVGAGSGYATAVLRHIAAEVFAIELQPELAALAESRMDTLGLDNIHITQGDGRKGWPQHAPFDAITVAAGAEDIPPALENQLAATDGRGGRLVIPVGPTRDGQHLLRLRRRSTGEPPRFERERFGPVRFVPLVGDN